MRRSTLPPEVRRSIRARLEHPFDLMMEAVAYRLEQLVAGEVRHYDLIPEGEYRRIRIYVSDVAKLRRFMAGEGPALSYVSFVGAQRDGVEAAIEATDRALIGRSPGDAPIIGYFSLQDPHLAWVNFVLFDDQVTLARWVDATRHAEDWTRAAAFFSGIEKSMGKARIVKGAVRLEPDRLTVRAYDTYSADSA